MQDAGVDLPAAANVQAICAGVIEDAVVALAPVLEAAAYVRCRGAGLEAHERVRKIVLELVVLGRKVIGLGLALTAHQRRMRIALVHVMRDRAHVVEELAEDVPAVFLRHHLGADQRVASGVDGLLQLKALAGLEPDVAEPFVCRRSRSVVGVGRGREPALVNATTVRAKGVQIVGMEPQAPAWLHERAGHPTRFEPEDSVAGIEGILDLYTSDHREDGRYRSGARTSRRESAPAGVSL